MGRETDRSRTSSRGKYFNNVSGIMGILYCFAVLCLVVHLIGVQIFDLKNIVKKVKCSDQAMILP